MLRMSRVLATAPHSDQSCPEAPRRGERPIEKTPGAALRNQRGFGFVSILLTLLILAVLYLGYFKMQNTMSGSRSAGISAINTSRDIACRTQRQQIERDVMMWSVSHPDEPPTIAALQHYGLHIPACPDGGQYSIAGRAVHCSVHR